MNWCTARLGNGRNGFILNFDFTNGAYPAGGLVFDRKGNLYGVTQGGGTGTGVAYELTKSAQNSWTEKVLYSFTGGSDGGFPYAERLVLDSAGRIYGTTSGGGATAQGVVFRLSEVGACAWKEQVLYSFSGVAANPYSGVILDGKGNLYGTCANGNGETTVGAVFELSPKSGGGYTETNLHLFDRTDGQFPEGALLRDAAGNLYGTTLEGGVSNMGVVFEVTP